MYIHILSMWMEEDHVHMYINIPVSQYIPHVMKILKWVSSKKIREEFVYELREYYRNPVLRAVGYFVCTVWEITDDIVRKYVEEQWKKDVLEDGFDV
jgi:putative transposase